MERTFGRRLMLSSLVIAGAAASASACSSADPPLPTNTNPVQVALNSPPPISGGTLFLSTSHTNLAIAADSDRDTVWLVDLGTQAVRSVALQTGDEPGRVVEDAAGHVHVALRGAGAVVTIDLDTAKVIDRTQVCSAPRGLAFDASSSTVHVACSGGELVSLPAAGGAPTRSLRLDRDLRDVVVQGSTLLVSRFRSAEVLAVDATGTVVNRQAPPAPDNTTPAPKLLGATFEPDAAWRLIPAPSGGAMLVHQLAATSTVVISQPGGYGSQGGGGMCDGTIVKTSLTAFGADGNPTHVGMPAPAITGASVPVDVAYDGIGGYGIVSAASDSVFLMLAQEVDPSATGPIGCQMGAQITMPGTTPDQPGQPVAIAGTGDGHFVVQIREPAQIVQLSSQGGAIEQVISLNAPSRLDTGHYLFHHNASSTSFIACASCHMEGHDDGHLWQFDTEGVRRTQTVAGGVLETAPLHWAGDMHDLPDIMNEVFVNRMGGAPQGVRHIAAFGDWLNSIQRYPASPTGTQEQIAHGQQIFTSADAGCTGCHNGKHFTNNQNASVGTGVTGQTFQVPTLLGVAARAPYMHDGCAKTLEDRFDPAQAGCNGGENHGHTSQLSASDIADLIAYLETL